MCACVRGSGNILGVFLGSFGLPGYPMTRLDVLTFRWCDHSTRNTVAVLLAPLYQVLQNTLLRVHPVSVIILLWIDEQLVQGLPPPYCWLCRLEQQTTITITQWLGSEGSRLKVLVSRSQGSLLEVWVRCTAANSIFTSHCFVGPFYLQWFHNKGYIHCKSTVFVINSARRVYYLCCSRGVLTWRILALQGWKLVTSDASGISISGTWWHNHSGCHWGP